MNKNLEKEFQYYLDHQEELVEKYNGKFLVIKECAVTGVYETELEAAEEASKKHELGTFLVQKCAPGEEDYTQTYNSRVCF